MKKIRFGSTNSNIVPTADEMVARVCEKAISSGSGRSCHSVGCWNEITLLFASKNGRLTKEIHVEKFGSLLNEHLRHLAAQTEAITIGYTAAETLTSYHGTLT